MLLGNFVIEKSEFLDNELSQLVKIFSFSRLEIYLSQSGLLEKLTLPNRNYYLETIAKRDENTLNIFYSFKNLATELIKKNIFFVPLKGIHLNLEFYKNLSLRPIRDIDILIKRNQIPDYLSVMKSLGYKFKLTNTQLENFVLSDYHYDLPVLINSHGVHVETHLRIIDQKFNTFIFESAKKSKVNNFNLYLMSHEDMIIHLVYHATTKNGFDNGIVSINDIFRIICKKKVDFQLLLKKAKCLSLEDNILLMLAIINKRLMHLGISDNLLNNLDEKITDYYEELILYNHSDSFAYRLLNKEDKSSAVSLKAYISEFGTDKINIFYYLRRLTRILVNTFKTIFSFLFSNNYRKDSIKVKSIMSYLKRKYD